MGVVVVGVGVRVFLGVIDDVLWYGWVGFYSIMFLCGL